MDLKRLIASSCRQKILKALLEVRELNVMSLVRKINSTYNQVDRNLRILEKEGVITIQQRGRLRMIKLNHENSKTKILIKALKILDTPIRYQQSNGDDAAPLFEEQLKETEPLAA